MVRVDEGTEASQTDKTPSEPSSSPPQTSITSSKIEKVSVLQPTETGAADESAKRQNAKGQNEDANPDEREILRQNQEIRKNKRQLSLSGIADANQNDLEPEVTFTPKNREASKHLSTPLLAPKDESSKEPPLTTKAKASFR